MGSSPKTTAFLKECMADSLLLLMQEKAYAKITVNEIAAAAGVNRSTWFRNFSNKNEALTFKIVQLWYRWIERHSLPWDHRYTLDDANCFFEFIREYMPLLQQLYSANLQSAIYDGFYQIILPQHMDDPLERYHSRFYSYGLFGMLDEWIKRGGCDTPEEMTALFHNIIANP